MSTFIKAAVAKATGRKFAAPAVDALTVKCDRIERAPYEELLEYRITINWGVIYRCRSEDYNAMMDNVMRKLREDVYGEFKELLIDLERTIYSQDRDAAVDVLRKIRKEVEGQIE